ncbi:DUF5314 domain-containing protein KNAG_0B05210 [Huiozyma naganishii CBS 8797]|uniref:Retrovirus-related Pol polyprotein from transposon TNT 1-94-like beta-barrel domain-containing protein n=1 Tax=Huiozyma naganishii (strain ATCC MYA-139 / BCRC 22969 / CBS 8797 / KCTC 17520 / NBRC 10181 / NCYC 3082 / Yp74L-3) TaxID=1071383 RepID=J7S3X2_HUIN7|nr:hypothetical protein KNAG_0B05210 [Kazachstania naganishii CBS 8797]CCK68954.1 hypothetical protein KNAG_0B05210 [Kazachstania naganishii CBS 8797]
MSELSVEEKRDRYMKYLVQQVMSPAVVSSKPIPTVLTGSLNFDLWFSRICSLVDITSLEWAEYMETGQISQTILGRNLGPRHVMTLRKTFEQALYLVIETSVNDEIKVIIENYYLNHQTSTSLDVLKYLKSEYSDLKVRGYVETASNLKPMMNNSLKEQAAWSVKFCNQLASYGRIDDPRSSPEERMAALVLMALNPDKIKSCMSFVGKRKSVSLKEVYDLLQDLGEGKAEHGEVAMAAKGSTYHSQIKCFHCGENHPISKCAKYKRDYPDAEIFRSHGKRGGPQSLYATLYASTPLFKGNWVFDSGGSIHVCNDAKMFSELKMCKREELTGTVGNATTKGFGKVQTNGFLLNNVAYFPDVGFNLISISAATATSNGRFVFGKNSLQMVSSDGTKSMMAKQKNGLYLLKTLLNQVLYVPVSLLFYAQFTHIFSNNLLFFLPST